MTKELKQEAQARANGQFNVSSCPKYSFAAQFTTPINVKKAEIIKSVVNQSQVENKLEVAWCCSHVREPITIIDKTRGGLVNCRVRKPNIVDVWFIIHKLTMSYSYQYYSLLQM